jgi:hypothetical protein
MTNTPSKKKALRPGLSEMRKEKHNYDGYIVRRSRFNHNFHRYVGAGARLSGGLKPALRFNNALSRASLALDTLDGIICDPSSWRTAAGKKHLTKKAGLALRELGFKIKSPA